MRIIILTSMLLMAAYAESGTSFTAQIPFDYSIRGMNAPAGPTTLTIFANGRVEVRTPSGQYLRQGMHSPKGSRKMELVFGVYGKQKVLEEVRMGRRGSLIFLPGDIARQWKALGLQAHIEVVPAGRPAD